MARSAPKNNPPRTSLRKRLAKQVAPTVEKHGKAIEQLGESLNAQAKRLAVLERAMHALTELAVASAGEEAVAKALDAVGLSRNIPQDPAREG